MGNVGGILKIAGTQTGSVNNLAATIKNINSVTFSHLFMFFAVAARFLTPQSWLPQFSRSLHGARNPHSTPQEMFRMLGASWGNLMLHNRTQHHEHQLGFQDPDVVAGQTLLGLALHVDDVPAALHCNEGHEALLPAVQHVHVVLEAVARQRLARNSLALHGAVDLGPEPCVGADAGWKVLQAEGAQLALALEGERQLLRSQPGQKAESDPFYVSCSRRRFCTAL